MDYNYKLDNFNLKYNFLYPLSAGVLIFILSSFTLNLLKVNFSLSGINPGVYIILGFFLVEGIFSRFLKEGIEVPFYMFLIEIGIYFLLLKFIPLNLNLLSLLLVWFLGVIAWININDFTIYFIRFHQDLRIINNQEEWTIEERKALNFSTVWQEFVKRLTGSNAILVLLWLIARGSRPGLLILTTLFLLGEFVLISAFFFEKKKLDWKLEELKIEGEIPLIWKRVLALVLSLVLFLTVILPTSFSGLTLEEIAIWFNEHIQNPRIDVSFPQQQGGEETSSPQYENAVEKPQPTPWIAYLFFIGAIIIAAVIILFIVGFLLTFLVDETRRSKGIKKFIVDFYRAVLKVIQGLWKSVFTGVKKIKTSRRKLAREGTVKRDEKNKERKVIKDLKRKSLPSNLKQLIVFVYSGMLKILSYRGQGKKASQTPFEYSQEIKDKSPQISNEIEDITEVYVEVIYSNHPLPKSIGQYVRGLWERLKKKV